MFALDVLWAWQVSISSLGHRLHYFADGVTPLVTELEFGTASAFKSYFILTHRLPISRNSYVSVFRGGSSMFKPPEPAEALVFSLRNDKITGDLRALARFPCLLLEGERVCRACGWRVRIPDVAIQAFFGARNGKIDENRLTSRPMAGESISHHFWISGQHVRDISIHN